ncbi:RHS repeat-associated core domain-containing protein [Pseudomonas sp. C1C7]|uniref:RHS repeat-associated core domain-containing protein n=1 Tax=Pseudomonas sp. C1C7 TaxID=2735272 RepID=UPI002114184F|nr:RHS repeat-associated core domain-containing protein [Pseudomonas sp. C1C7]
MPASRPSPHSAARVLLLVSDVQQSVLAELDRTGPNRLAYTPYGAQSSLLAAGTHLGFNGQLRERSTGRYHLGNGHRVYNPVLKRFQSPDRLSPFEEGGLNAYAYCKGDPLNYTDPTGEFMASVLPIIQRGLTVALHTFAPVAFIFGSKVSGVALHATRFSLGGSVISVVGATMQLGGSPAGAIVQTVGTSALIVGAATRAAVAVKSAYQSNMLWKTVKNNVKNIVGWPDAAKPPKSPAPLTSVGSVSDLNTPKEIRSA